MQKLFAVLSLVLAVIACGCSNPAGPSSVQVQAQTSPSTLPTELYRAFSETLPPGDCTGHGIYMRGFEDTARLWVTPGVVEFFVEPTPTVQVNMYLRHTGHNDISWQEWNLMREGQSDIPPSLDEDLTSVQGSKRMVYNWTPPASLDVPPGLNGFYCNAGTTDATITGYIKYRSAK